MRSLVSWCVAVALLAGPALAGQVRTTLALSGLSCAACVPAVTKALREVPGVHAVAVDRAHADVIADDGVPASSLVDAVRRLGYEARVAER